VTLRDGTRLVLGPATELRVPADFGVRARELELSGEAYFSVVHDVRHPFAVHTGHAVVRDVGTEFVVRAYREDDVERIAVSAGRVVVTAGRGANDTIPASAGDVATVDRAGRLTLRSGMDVSRYVAWMQGTIVFDDAPIRDVIRDIKRTYGVELSLADTSLATRTVTASFRGTEAAADVLDAIAHAVGARVEWDGARAILIRHLAGRAVTLPINTVQTRTLHP
jgi:ferric-dicitrate binding protein FerR (iron transport regulator)